MTDLQRKQIVVVEDEEKIAQLLQRQLELAGYDVHTETTGRGALAYLAKPFELSEVIETVAHLLGGSAAPSPA
jgi:DNA-binding response OmpR family regulator